MASSGEAGGELHQGAGRLLHLLLALLRPLPRRPPGLRSAAGPLALGPHHHLRLPAVPTGLHRRLAGPARHLRPVSSSVHPLIAARLLPQLPSAGTQPSPAPHGLHLSPTLRVPVLGGSQKLQYCLTEDEGQGTHSVYWEDVVMLPRGGDQWTQEHRFC